MRHVKDPTNDDAEALAIQALTFLAADAERIHGFLAETGIGPASLRATARDPTFLAAVLNYIIADGSLLAEFSAVQGTDPAAVADAQQRLSGPDRHGG